MRRDDKRWLAWALGALVVAAAAPVVVLQALGMLESADDKRTAALLALVGVTVTACASVIGTLVSRQSERRLAHEHEDEQSRLRLDAAMKAGALFNANGDASPDPAAVASGLLALTQLDREDLAVALLVDLWDRKPDAASAQDVRVRSVSHETAILVLDAALSSTNANAQLVAAELLCRNADRLDICQSLHWPASIDGRWNAHFGVKTKVLIVDALVHMAVKGEASLNALQSLAVRLYSIAALDPGVHVKGCVGMLLEAIVPALDRMDVRSLMQGPTEITIDDIRLAATHAHANPDRVFYKVVRQRSVDLAAWSKRCSACDFRPGALAATAVSATGPRDAEPPPVALAG